MPTAATVPYKPANRCIIYPEDDAIAKINQQVADDPEISSIHLVSHGSPGCLYLGNGELSLSGLSDHAPALSKWQERESLDILIYGCNVGAGDVGEKFLRKLREITQANIAVSANKTGNKELGGDWNLEIRLGNIEPTLAFNHEVRESYVGVFGEVVLAADIDPVYGSDFKDLTVFNGELYFNASGDNNGQELWKYNPTDGASLVADIEPIWDLYKKGYQ
ncbi:MAG: DUF4347 domain-containing protein [Pleurocapsa sp. MO_226.B13]|nr:DUF4347 domain-containing protein [Pleurocapsa sp. MO_226.B13]